MRLFGNVLPDECFLCLVQSGGGACGIDERHALIKRSYDLAIEQQCECKKARSTMPLGTVNEGAAGGQLGNDRSQVIRRGHAPVENRKRNVGRGVSDRLGVFGVGYQLSAISYQLKP